MPDQNKSESAKKSTEGPKSVPRRTFVAGAGVAVAGMSGVTAARSDRAKADDKDDWANDDDSEPPQLIAHRGFAGVNPENTVGAVEAAARGGQSNYAPSRGADAIEIDVVPTADGDVVVFHDDRLSSRDGGERGLTDTNGVIWETATDVVTNAEVLESGETVPLLTEVFDAIPPSVGVNIELKNPGSFDLQFASNLSKSELATQKEIWHDFVVDVLDIAAEYNNDILVSSFYEAALAVTREHSSYPVAPLLWDSIEDGLAITREHDAEAIHPPYNMIEGTPFFADSYYTEGSDWADIDLLAVAHEEGRDVNVYTLATWFQAEQLAATGVDGLISDYPELLRFGATHD